MSADTQTLTLADFLLARFAEDERVAREASPGPWRTDAEGAIVFAIDGIEVCDGFALSGPQTRATTTHIATHDPARVLRQCEALRAVVELHTPSLEHEPGHGVGRFCEACAIWDEEDSAGIPPTVPWPCPTLRALATIYADHPDYRDKWRP